jgi:beta-1,4-mannosyl-glycoprotein beta-1,4-N-acetylglucosaminyltransferase
MERSTICLNMIVKNESHIIEKTLAHLHSLLNFDYWVICDTGSTDNTKEIITNFFNKVGVSGELVTHEWKGFDVCRSYALECAYNKSDYVLIFDADDHIHGDFRLPNNGTLNHDRYFIRLDKNIAYYRPLIVNNRMHWRFKGVLHEYLVNDEPIKNGEMYIEGNYYVESGRTGGRSNNPNKYIEDARVLENAIQDADDVNDISLKERYVYYCAQSFYDANHYVDAEKYYSMVLNQNNWNQEKYIACMRIGDILYKTNKHDEAIMYWDRAGQYDPTRVDCAERIIKHFYFKGDHVLVLHYFRKYALVSEIVDYTKYLLLDTNAFTMVRYFASVSASYAGVPWVGYECCKYLILNNVEFEKNNTIYNMSFYIKEIENDDNLQEKILLLKTISSKITTFFNKEFDEKFALHLWNYSQQYMKKYNNDLYEETSKIVDMNSNKQPQNNIIRQENNNSKNILFYVGYSTEPWNLSLLSTKAVGGSEKAAAYLTEQMYTLLKYEHEFNNCTDDEQWRIYVAGGVEEFKSNDGGITYVPYDKLVSLIDTIEFNTIVVSRYISFMELYPNFKTSQLYICAHDTTLYGYGCNLTSEEIIKKWNKSITGCVCLTDWHKEVIINQFSLLTEKMSVINNGINTHLIHDAPISNKQKHSFIYSSCAERGLDRLLELWSDIKKQMPNATLHVCTYNPFPRNQSESQMKMIIDNDDSIIHYGRLATNELYNLMSKCEYWLYPTCFTETSCITAMELMAHNVICLYYPIAGLVNTVSDFGTPVQFNTEVNTLISIDSDEEKKQVIREKAKKYAFDCSWKNRAKSWLKLFNLNQKQSNKQNPNDIKENKQVSSEINTQNIWCFYYNEFRIETIAQYLYNQSNYNNKNYKIVVTSDFDEIVQLNPEKITYVYRIFDTNIIDYFSNRENVEVSILQTEPLNIDMWLNSILQIHKSYPSMKIYDYSKSNVKIIEKSGILNCEYLPYNIQESEKRRLIEYNSNNEKTYDFGIIINWKVCPKTTQRIIATYRRRNVIYYLKKQGFTVNIISGFDDERDKEISKCRFLLNIHGQIIESINPKKEECSNIFEHIRCDRLLECGYNVLSETSYELDSDFINKYQNLTIINYEDFFNADIMRTLINKYNERSNINKNSFENNQLDKRSKHNEKNTNKMFEYGSITGTDKVTHHEYHKYYEPHIKDLYNKNGGILEIGLGTGVSLPMWVNLFPNAHIYGVDCGYEDSGNDKYTIIKADQSNKNDLNNLVCLLQNKDIFFINDDGSHIPEHQILSFNILFPILQEGGVYIIEDIETSYWTRGECYGYKTEYGFKNERSIIEIFKEGIDIVNREFIDDNLLTNKILHHDFIEQISFSRNCIIIKKGFQQKRFYRFNHFIESPVKVVDAFIFYNELEMLRYRLNILNDVVDYFIIVESTHTFVGKEKPLFYNENKHLFKDFTHKIIHIIVDDIPYKYPNIEFDKQQQWSNETHQRNAIKKGIEKINLSPRDLLLLSDVDEIFKPNVIQNIKLSKDTINISNAIEMDLYYYNITNMLDSKWYLSKIISYNNYKNMNKTINEIRNHACQVIPCGGWHLSYFGDEKNIKNKIENFSHQEFNKPELINETNIKERIKNSKDLFNREHINFIHVPICENKNLPYKYKMFLGKYTNSI